MATGQAGERRTGLDVLDDVVSRSAVDGASDRLSSSEDLCGKPQTVEHLATNVETSKGGLRTSLTVPESDLAKDLNRILRAISMISSRGMSPEWAMFLTFFRSRGGSVRLKA